MLRDNSKCWFVDHLGVTFSCSPILVNMLKGSRHLLSGNKSCCLKQKKSVHLILPALLLISLQGMSSWISPCSNHCAVVSFLQVYCVLPDTSIWGIPPTNDVQSLTIYPLSDEGKGSIPCGTTLGTTKRRKKHDQKNWPLPQSIWAMCVMWSVLIQNLRRITVLVVICGGWGSIGAEFGFIPVFRTNAWICLLCSEAKEVHETSNVSIQWCCQELICHLCFLYLSLPCICIWLKWSQNMLFLSMKCDGLYPMISLQFSCQKRMEAFPTWIEMLIGAMSLMLRSHRSDTGVGRTKWL